MTPPADLQLPSWARAPSDSALATGGAGVSQRSGAMKSDALIDVSLPSGGVAARFASREIG
eukprot:2806896-Pyramimonas_sp.AAC.1